MGRPQSNGLVELHDEKLDRNEFFCMDLVAFLFGDRETDFHEAWTRAEDGDCPYRDKCARYARTMERHKGEPRLQGD